MTPTSGADDSRIGAPSPADNPTTPQRPAVRPGPLTPGSRPEPSPAPSPAARRVSPGRTRVGGTWIGFILGAVVLIFLLVFILQNLVPVEVTFLGLRGTLPLGIWLLFAAIAGVLLLAVPGLGRLGQWRRATKRARR